MEPRMSRSRSAQQGDLGHHSGSLSEPYKNVAFPFECRPLVRLGRLGGVSGRLWGVWGWLGLKTVWGPLGAISGPINLEIENQNEDYYDDDEDLFEI